MDVDMDSRRILKYQKDHTYTTFVQIIHGLVQAHTRNVGRSGMEQIDMRTKIVDKRYYLRVWLDETCKEIFEKTHDQINETCITCDGITTCKDCRYNVAKEIDRLTK